MCGIVGFQGRFDPHLIGRMSDCIAHRGPDSDGSVVFPDSDARRASAFGFRRLAIIDLSEEGNQPMTVSCERCGAHDQQGLSLVFNGEIYNFRELRGELEARGHRFHSRTDSEVLLHLYAEEGLDMLGRLNGMFGLAIRDGREQGRPDGVARGDVLVARDPIGVKPLYFAELPAGVAFASELKALLQLPGLSRELDHVALHQQLAYLWTPAPRTMLKGVRKLPPGEAMLLRDGAIGRSWSYFELGFGRDYLEGTDDEIATSLRTRLQQAVERQMVADVPVGAFLSGGLDSSAVVAMMRRVRPDGPIPCYSIGFAGDADVEGNPADLPYARRVAQHLGVDLRTIEVGHTIIDQLDRVIYHLDEPQADPAPINALLISEQARRDGITVLLSGAGGDDIFSGYRRHQALHMERLWRRLPLAMRSPIAAVARRINAGDSALNLHGHRARRFAKLLANVDGGDAERIVSAFWWSDEGLRRGLYSPMLSAELATARTAEPLLATLGDAAAGSPLDAMLLLEMRHFLADHNLAYTDKMGMAVGVEVRVPLLDLELVDFGTRIPPHVKMRGMTTKAVFKRAMEGILPHDVIYRPKTGFGAPLRHWLRHELKDRVAEALSPAAIRRRGLFDPAAVERLRAMDDAGRVDGAYTIFALLCLELWCQRFVDGTSNSANDSTSN